MLNNDSARAFASRFVDPVAKLMLRFGVSPDVVTLVVTVATCAAALICVPEQRWFLGALLIAFFVSFDLLDGTMARMSGRSGPWGAFLDSTLDRVADGAIFGGMLLGFANVGDLRTATAALACLVGGAVVSYAKARAESINVECNVGIAERAERVMLALGAAALYGLGVPYVLPAALWILAVLSWVTVGQRIVHVRGVLRERSTSASDLEGNDEHS
jgi:CDP-diacylglycerol--glycerol-3-phosphate 3-phosphatidyltransferase